MKFLKRVLKHCTMVIVFAMVFYGISAYVVINDVQATSVSVRTVASGFSKMMVGPSLNNQVAIMDLYDGPYVYEESEKLSHVVCLIPFNYTKQYLNEGGEGLVGSIMWRDGSLLSSGGILSVDNHFYYVDFEDAMAMEIDLFWERNSSSVGLRGVVLDVTAETAPEVDTMIEQVICTGICLVSGRVSANMAVVLFALIMGLIGYLLCLALYDLLTSICECLAGVQNAADKNT